MNEERLSWRAIGGVALVIVAVVLGAMFLIGGQTSTILSKVGAAVGPPDGAPSGDTTGGVDVPADDGKGEIADTAAQPPELLIIRTGEVEIEVADLGAAITSGRTHILELGGYVSASDESSFEDGATASAMYRVPVDHWEEALDGIRALATKVRQLRVVTEAVTNQVVDLGARIANLRTSEAALQKIMAQATKISDVLAVQGELTKVRGDIERLVAEKATLEGRAAFGTLTVVFNLPATPATEEVRRGWDPASDADRATGTLIGLGQAATSIAIWLGIVGLPIAVIAALTVLLAWRVGRYVNRRGAAEPGAS